MSDKPSTNKQINFRLSDDDHLMIKRLANIHGMSMTEFLLYLVNQQKDQIGISSTSELMEKLGLAS